MPPESPALTSLQQALTRFAFPASNVQSSRHIRSLHWYVACRLVIEGGFHPDRIRPRPPWNEGETESCFITTQARRSLGSEQYSVV